MKKWIALILLISVVFVSKAAWAGQDPLDLEVKNLYSAPQEYSNEIYSIPIEVKLLDISEDGNWYKVKISFYLGPFGYTYVGWANIPVARILAEREQEREAAEIAALMEETP